MKRLNCQKTKVMLVGFLAAIVLVGGRAKADFTFGEPVNLGPRVNTAYDEGPTCFLADGLELYINSTRPGSLGDIDLWVMTRTTREEDWEPPVHLGPAVNSSVRECDACISADGLELYFDAYRRPGGYGNWDIWVSRRQTRNDPWGTAVNLGPPINTSFWDECPSISADGLELYFTSNRSGGYGAQDIWVSKRSTRDDPWGEPVNLGAIVNSSAHECGVKISSDSLLLFFSGDTISPYQSGGFGLSDIWMTRRATRVDEWNEPVNLGPLVNSSSHDYGPVISQEGDALCFGSNRLGGSGSWDMYQAPILPIVDFNGDGRVEIGDLVTLIDGWGTNKTLCDIGPMPWGDGIVNEADLKVLMRYWGQEAYDPTLIAHWRLDEASGIIAADSTGANDSKLLGNPLWQPAAGKVGGALQLDGVDDCVNTPPVLNPAARPFSIFAWIKGGAPGQVIVSQVLAADWLCADPSEGSLMTSLGPPPGRIVAPPLVSELVITDGNWHCIGLVWDGSYRHLYVDGVEVAIDAAPLSALAGSVDGLFIGCDKAMEPGTYWSGLIDDVRIYNRAVIP